jgi:hypothetical protein
MQQLLGTLMLSQNSLGSYLSDHRTQLVPRGARVLRGVSGRHSDGFHSLRRGRQWVSLQRSVAALQLIAVYRSVNFGHLVHHHQSGSGSRCRCKSMTTASNKLGKVLRLLPDEDNGVL